MKESVPREVYGQLAEIIVEGGAKKATKFLSPLVVVKATRIGKRNNRDLTDHFVMTAGRPNYLERLQIKDFKASGEHFPVKKIQIKW